MANKDDASLNAALLSKSQRAWLADGAPDPETAAHRSLRSRIRERLETSLYDYQLILNTIEETELWTVYSPANRDTSEWREIDDGMASSIGLFVYAIHARARESEYGGLDDPDVEGFTPITGHAATQGAEDMMVNQLVKRGIKVALRELGEDLEEYEPLSYKTDPTEITDLLDRFKKGERLTYEEFEKLRRAGVGIDESIADVTKSKHVSFEDAEDDPND